MSNRAYKIIMIPVLTLCLVLGLVIPAAKNFFKELPYLDLSMKRLEYILRRNEELFADVFS